MLRPSTKKCRCWNLHIKDGFRGGAVIGLNASRNVVKSGDSFEDRDPFEWNAIFYGTTCTDGSVTVIKFYLGRSAEGVWRIGSGLSIHWKKFVILPAMVLERYSRDLFPKYVYIGK